MLVYQRVPHSYSWILEAWSTRWLGGGFQRFFLLEISETPGRKDAISGHLNHQGRWCFFFNVGVLPVSPFRSHQGNPSNISGTHLEDHPKTCKWFITNGHSWNWDDPPSTWLLVSPKARTIPSLLFPEGEWSYHHIPQKVAVIFQEISNRTHWMDP